MCGRYGSNFTKYNSHDPNLAIHSSWGRPNNMKKIKRMRPCPGHATAATHVLWQRLHRIQQPPAAPCGLDLITTEPNRGFRSTASGRIVCGGGLRGCGAGAGY